jgi:predicted nucleic acid-binding protein
VSVFVDTSAWYAAVDETDAGYLRARYILGGGHPLVTTDHVLVETWLLMKSRTHQVAADGFWRRIRAGAARIESTTPSDLEVAWQIGERFSDQDFSLVDRTSFATMMRLGITRVASFDSHFAVFRYGPRDSLAFEVLR